MRKICKLSLVVLLLLSLNVFIFSSTAASPLPGSLTTGINCNTNPPDSNNIDPGCDGGSSGDCCVPIPGNDLQNVYKSLLC